jgi:hypothetical protein
MWIITNDVSIQSEHILGMDVGGIDSFQRPPLKDFPQGKRFFVGALLPENQKPTIYWSATRAEANDFITWLIVQRIAEGHAYTFVDTFTYHEGAE